MDEEFKRKIIARRGELGKKWLGDLPDIIKTYEQKWNISVFAPFKLSYNYVAPAKTADNKGVVLKVSFPQNLEFIHEIDALHFYNGSGAVRILQEDRANGVMLLEEAKPGTRLRDIPTESEQIAIVSRVMQKFHKPVQSDTYTSFPTVVDWGGAFKRYRENFPKGSIPIPQRMVEKAEEIFTEYPKERKENVLLHGDLHSDNILLFERGWLIIDPKGVIGEREFELGAYLRNPYYDFSKGRDFKEIEKERILRFSELLGFDKKRILDWAFACSVITLIWFLEDEKYFNEIYVKNVELLNEISF